MVYHLLISLHLTLLFLYVVKIIQEFTGESKTKQKIYLSGGIMMTSMILSYHIAALIWFIVFALNIVLLNKEGDGRK